MELTVFKPTTLLYQRTCDLPVEDNWTIKDGDLRKRVKYLVICKINL